MATFMLLLFYFWTKRMNLGTRFSKLESDISRIKWGIGMLLVIVLLIAGKVWMR